MTTVEKGLPRSDWALSNPWAWLLAGVAALAGGFLAMRVLGPGASLHGWLVALGVPAVLVGLCLRCRSGDVSFLDRLAPATRQRALLGLVVLFGVLAGGVTLLVLGNFLRTSALPWGTTESIWLWLVVAPWSAFLMQWFLKARASGSVNPRSETAALLSLAALGLFLACWALYNSEVPVEWDSVRLVLGVAALVAFLGGMIAAGSARVRKVLVSVVILVHFGAILTSVASAPPGPFLARIAYVQLYWPYLEFMHLNNAYRFYSPEPSPATQLWFKLEYLDEQGKPLSPRWVKMPDINAEGESKGYTLELQYYRRLMLTENAGRAFPAQPPPETTAWLAFGGYPPSQDPMAPRYQVPGPLAKKMNAAIARFLCEQPHPQHPTLKPSRVMIYRVLHKWVNPGDFAMGMDPKDLTLYFPYYQGKYDSTGNLIDPKEKGLYCLLPFVREEPTGPAGPVILAYIYKHSGDSENFRMSPKGKPLR